jgi:CHASE1-domain containing sensor protein
MFIRTTTTTTTTSTKPTNDEDKVLDTNDDISMQSSNNKKQSGASHASTSSPSSSSPSSSSSSSTSCLSLVHQNPTLLWVPLLLLVALVVAGLTIVYSTIASEQDVARNEALELATETGAWFSSELDAALLPLFSLAQFATELDIFDSLPDRIGAVDAPGSLPFIVQPSTATNTSDNEEQYSVIPTHRNVTGVCTEPALVQRFTHIASTIKRNAGMQGVLVNLQLAPEAVVCLVHPLNNTEDFGGNNAGDVFMDNTGAIGHDLLHDPERKFIAQATVAADSVIIAGPLPLKQCTDSCHPLVEKAFIARLPISSTNGHVISVNGTAYQRWGFAVAIINWMALVERSNIYENFAERGLTFSLTRTDYIAVTNSSEHEEKVVVLAQAPNWQPDGAGKWKTVAVALETTNNEWYMTVGYPPHVHNRSQIMATTAVIFVSLLLATLLFVVLAQKQAHVNSSKEQAARLVQTAQDSMTAERDLNDYIAHEVRSAQILRGILAFLLFTCDLTNSMNPLYDCCLLNVRYATHFRLPLPLLALSRQQ